MSNIRKKGSQDLESLHIEIKTLTPIWTGDVNRNCSEIKETGIIGSMRWWYEAIVRGMGGYACDPTYDGKNEHNKKCELENKKFQNSFESGKSIQQALYEQSICPVCQLFGCNGWSKKFRLITDNNLVNEKIDWNNPIKINNNRGWFIHSGFIGSMKMDFLLLNNFNNESIRTIKILMKIMEKWGALGARTQFGYGIFKFNNQSEPILNNDDITSLINYLGSIKAINNGNDLSMPSLKDFFFCKIISDDSFTKEKSRLEKSLKLRFNLRRLNIFRNDKSLRHFLLGTTSYDKTGSKLFISRIYDDGGKNEMRISGWIPRDVKNRDQVLNDIKAEITKLDSNPIWREYNSERDDKRKIDDFPKFLTENILEI